MIEYIETAIDLTKKYNQFKSKNDLIIDIVNVTDADEIQAESTAASICKVLTFWIEAYSKNLTDYEFIEFYDDCITHGYVIKDKKGFYTYLALSLDKLAEKYDISLYKINSFKDFVNYKRNDEFMGTVRIEKNDNMHSIICYRDAGGKLKISDTGRRGIDVNLFDFINEDNFKYCTIMEV